MWVAAAAVGVGLLVAAVTNVGSNSSRIFGLLVVVVAVPAVITLGYEGLRNRARSKGAHPKSFRSAPEHLRHSSPTFEAVPEDRQFGNDRGKLTDGDWEALRALCTTLGTAQLAWLKSTEFVTPWLDAHARSVIELEARVLEIIERPFQEAVSAALEALLEAASAFSEFYAGSTYPDPLLLGEDWRFFDVESTGAAQETAELWGGRAAHLHGLSVAVATAYDDLVAAPPPAVAARTKARA